MLDQLAGRYCVAPLQAEFDPLLGEAICWSKSKNFLSSTLHRICLRLGKFLTGVVMPMCMVRALTMQTLLESKVIYYLEQCGLRV